jgi:hypothetical protein
VALFEVTAGRQPIKINQKVWYKIFMFDIIKTLLFGSSQVDYLIEEKAPGENAASFSIGEQKAKWDDAIGGTAEQTDAMKQMSLSGKELPRDWPSLATPEEEQRMYDMLYNPEDDRSQPPTHAHTERLSYELQSGDKRLRYFAVSHQRDMQGQEDPNMVQYDLLEKRFTESPPELVLYEGFIDDVNYPLTRDRAIALGEPAFMAYLVQQHNSKLQDGDKPVAIESADHSVNTLPNNQRDKAIVKNVAEKFGEFDSIDIVMGSGHAIREKYALLQYFDQDTKRITDKRIGEIRKELTRMNN